MIAQFLDSFPDLVSVCAVVKRIADIKGHKFTCLITMCSVVNIRVISRNLDPQKTT